MPLTIGSRLGPYEVLAPLGAGGMGEVYRARDTRLDRAVAIKILSESFANDPERLARFEREAKTLAALNHPNIAIIHGFEEANPSTGSGSAVRALVMELVEGPTLADRIAQGRVPLDEALPIARQIADALEAAHDQGIIHRDLKPANIKLRPDGTVKVLDFGLAKAIDGSGGRSGLVSMSPTITSPVMMTGMGVILGTAAYMAPEQARGKAVDKRADIWAFGCVVYEMLSGRQAFEGAEVTDVLARVIEREPDVAALPANTPAAIRRLLRRCLQKDRRRRLADAADARLEIDEALMSPAPDAPANATPAPRLPLWRKAIPAAAVIIVGLTAAYGAWTLKPAPPRAVTRFAIVLPEGDTFTFSSRLLALSPDGTRLAYGANNRVYLRALEQLDAAPIAGGERTGFAAARSPFFSPDGQWIGFWEGGLLKKVSVSGGAPIILSAVSPPPSGATWAADNTILFGRGAEGIWRVSGNGGTLERIITVDAGQRAHGPQLLPDGRTVLFTLAPTASWDEAQIVVHSLDTGTRRTLITGGTDGRYVSTGHLVYALRDTLLAVPFDTKSLSINGGPVPLVDRVWRPAGAQAPGAAFAVSSNGTLAYVPPVSVLAAHRTLVWVDRQGREEAIAAPPRAYTHPRLAPDGTRLAIEFPDDEQNIDIWVWELPRGTWTRVTSDPAADREPTWTPDGQRLVFSSWRTGSINLFWQAANGTGKAERLIELTRQARATPAMSPDGRHLVFRATEMGNTDLRILDLRGGRGAEVPSLVAGEPRPLLRTSFEEYNAEISPDGRWLAYQSNSSGVFDVYVRPFPDVESDQRRVSTAGGTEPLWARDGRELFYRTLNGAVMRVPIASGTTWTAGAPTQLFDAGPYAMALAATGDASSFVSRSYDVSADGRRFLMIKNSDPPAPTSTAPRIVVVQNWFEELKRVAPAR